MGGFVVLAVVNALTDGFSVMLMVPLLESFSSAPVFTGVPILEGIGSLLQPLDPLTRLRWVAGLLLLVILLKGVAQYGVDVIVYIIPQRVERDLRLRAFDAMMRSELGFSETVSAGELGNLTASFPARVGIAARFLSQIIASCLTILLLLVVLVAITPDALIGLAAFAVVASIAFRAMTGKLSQRLDRETTAATESFSQAYFEAVSNKRTIRVFNATDAFLDRISQLLDRLRRVQTRTVMVHNATYPFFATLAGVLVCGTVLIASLGQPDRAQALLGFMMIFLVGVFRMLGPFSVLHIAGMHYSIHGEAVARLDVFLRAAAERQDLDGAVALDGNAHRIEFRDVTFRYAPDRHGVEHLSFGIEPGEFVALVGQSGAGKSTVFGLLTRLYRPDSGEITIDGIDLNDIRIRTWWKSLSFVSQDVPIFNASVKENILFGSTADFDPVRFDEALRLSAADGFVAELPDGADSHLGEFGSLLSAGERQRLALARAFYHRRPFILLDEVTSQLDPETETHITRSLARLKRDGHTIIAIAHRIATIGYADRILVIENGRCVADGEHATVLRESPYFRHMTTAGTESGAG